MVYTEAEEAKLAYEELVHAQHLICLVSNGSKNLLQGWDSLPENKKMTKLAHMAKMLCQALETLSGR